MRALRPVAVAGLVSMLLGGVAAASQAAPDTGRPTTAGAAPAHPAGRGADRDAHRGARDATRQAAYGPALDALNAYRTAAGLRPLVVEDWADSDAQGWAEASATAGGSGPNPDAANLLAPWVVRGELYAFGPQASGAQALVDHLEDTQPGLVYSATATRVGVGYAVSASGTAYLYIVLTDDPFSDVTTGQPFADEIFWLVTHYVTTGYPDGTFRPTATVTREAMAAFLYRFIELAPELPTCDAAAGQPFTDVTTGHPFCGAIAWLADSGITTGYPDGSFRPGGVVTREAMAAFLFRWLNWWNGTDEPIPACDPGAERLFTDVPSGHPFCGAIEWLAGTGVTTGWPDGTFRPGQPIERQAMAAFLYRFNDLL